MEYLADHGSWSYLPLDKVKSDLAMRYPASLARAAAGAGASQSDAGDRFANDASRARG